MLALKTVKMVELEFNENTTFAFFDDYYCGLYFSWQTDGHHYLVRSVNNHTFVDLFFGSTKDSDWEVVVGGFQAEHPNGCLVQELREIFLTIPETWKYYKTIKTAVDNFEECHVHTSNSHRRPVTPFYCFFEAEIKKEKNTFVNRIDCVVNETVAFEGCEGEIKPQTINDLKENLNLLVSFNPSVRIYERYVVSR